MVWPAKRCAERAPAIGRVASKAASRSLPQTQMTTRRAILLVANRYIGCRKSAAVYYGAFCADRRPHRGRQHTRFGHLLPLATGWATMTLPRFLPRGCANGTTAMNPRRNGYSVCSILSEYCPRVTYRCRWRRGRPSRHQYRRAGAKHPPGPSRCQRCCAARCGWHR